METTASGGTRARLPKESRQRRRTAKFGTGCDPPPPAMTGSSLHSCAISSAGSPATNVSSVVVTAIEIVEGHEPVGCGLERRPEQCGAAGFDVDRDVIVGADDDLTLSVQQRQTHGDDVSDLELLSGHRGLEELEGSDGLLDAERLCRCPCARLAHPLCRPSVHVDLVWVRRVGAVAQVRLRLAAAGGEVDDQLVRRPPSDVHPLESRDPCLPVRVGRDEAIVVRVCLAALGEAATVADLLAEDIPVRLAPDDSSRLHPSPRRDLGCHGLAQPRVRHGVVVRVQQLDLRLHRERLPVEGPVPWLLQDDQLARVLGLHHDPRVQEQQLRASAGHEGQHVLPWDSRAEVREGGHAARCHLDRRAQQLRLAPLQRRPERGLKRSEDLDRRVVDNVLEGVDDVDDARLAHAAVSYTHLRAHETEADL
eukprot:3248927-Rhodomonas_salina.2